MIIYSLAFSFLILCLGLLFISKPALTIELQRRFYARINWKMEPVSMVKELRNTRIMGFIILLLSLSAVSYLLIVTPIP